MSYHINEYTDERGSSPYAEWLGALRDKKARAKVIMQVDRMEAGLFGDAQSVGDGLSELRIHYVTAYITAEKLKIPSWCYVEAINRRSPGI